MVGTEDELLDGRQRDGCCSPGSMLVAAGVMIAFRALPPIRSDEVAQKDLAAIGADLLALAKETSEASRRADAVRIAGGTGPGRRRTSRPPPCDRHRRAGR